MIRPWVFEFFPELKTEPGGASQADVTDYFRRYLDLWQRVEELGYEGIFFSEHHFGGSFSPSPNLLIAAVAGRTRRLRLGVMGMVVPYYSPARIVEEIGMLDHLSGGRLEIGTAVGIPQELARVSLTMDDARVLNDEALEIIDGALSTGQVTYHGKHFNYDDLRLLPRPAQQPGPPKWTTVVSPDSARKAARRGSKITTGFNSTDQIKLLFDAYRDEAKSCGSAAGPEQLGLRRRVVIARTQSEADRLSEAIVTRYKDFAAQDPRLKLSQVPDAPKQKGEFVLSADEFIAGTAEAVAQTIIDQCRRTGAGHFLAVLHWGSSLEEVSEAHEVFGREVIPALRHATV